MSDIVLPRFNIAALPVEAAVQDEFFRAAASVEKWADGYRLASGKSLPHVSLCHFRAADAQDAEKLVAGFIGMELNLQNTGLYVTQGVTEHAGKFWAGYIERRSAPLMRVQAEAVALLRDKAAEIFHDSGDNYFPHFTLVRSAAPLTGYDKSVFSPQLIGRPLACKLCLGLSDENGQFLKILAGRL